MTRHIRTLTVAAGAFLVAGTGAAAALEGVVASIKPIHSLVADVMKGVGEPTLLVDGAASPHAYSLRPSQAEALEEARLIFWVGENMEVFLSDALDTLAADAKVVELAQAGDLVRHELREGGPFEAHDHHEHGHTGEDEDHDHDHHHAHETFDMHLWLDPVNAQVFVREIEAALSESDPENAGLYARNASALAERLDVLIAETEAALAPVRGRDFVVFHDAYAYYEHRFDIPAAGSITVSPEALPGAGRVAEIKAKIAELDAACVFAEPQFEPSLIAVVTEGTDARTGVLDPLGAELAAGPELYFDLIRKLTASLTECLTDSE